jgi:hypothetical protein
MAETTMPVICQQPPDGSLSLSIDGAQTSQAWTVLARSQSEALRVLYAKIGIARGSFFRDMDGSTPDNRLQCLGLTATARVPSNGRTRGLYLVTAEYGVPQVAIAEPKPGGRGAYTWSGSIEYGPVDVDVDGAAIASSSDEPISLQGPKMCGRLTVRWYPAEGAALSFARMYAYFGTVNSDIWTPKDPAMTGDSIAPGQALCLNLSRSMGENDMVMMEGEFLLKAEGHQPRVMDVGRRVVLSPEEFEEALEEGVAAGEDFDLISPYRPIKDANGDPTTDPVPLNGLGQVLKPGEPPVALDFKIHRALPFADLGI